MPRGAFCLSTDAPRRQAVRAIVAQRRGTRVAAQPDMRSTPAVGAVLLAVAAADAAACAPVVHPPAPPLGFLNPPRTEFSGVLSHAVAGTGPAAASPEAAADTVEIDYLGERQARVRLGPGCELGAFVVVPPYLEVPGTGFSRQVEGVLRFDPGGSCALEGAGPITVGAGLVDVRGVGLLNLVAAGRDAQGLPASVRFTGTLAHEGEADPPAAEPGKVRVHLLAELVTSCPACRYGHTSIALPGRFPFEPKLEQQVPTAAGLTWTPICAAPCAAAVDTGAWLRVAGAGIPDSQPFALPTERQRVVLKASSTGDAARAFGHGFVAAGIVYVALGAIFVAAGSAEARNDPSKGRHLELGGAAWAAASLAFFLPAAVVLGYHRTTVTTDAGETLVPR